MSSNRPPQLHLALPANTTSFKRSFEQFGFDLESPLSQAEPGSSSSGTLGSSGDGHERSKRPRSESSLSDMAESSSASSSGNSSDGTLTSGSELEAPFIAADPPRLPTPELEDIEMAYYLPTEEPSYTSAPPAASPQRSPQHSPQHDEQYRAILDRFNAFDSEINVLRVGISETAQETRSSSPPPSLPPLALPSSDAESAPPRIDFARPITPPMFWQHVNPSFQERLDEALHALRSSPPLADVEAFLSGTEQERRHQSQDLHDTSSREARTRSSSLVSDWVNRDRDYDARRAPRLSTNAGQLSPFRLDFDVDDTNSTRWAPTDASDPPRSRPPIAQPHVPPPLPPMTTGQRLRQRRPPPASSSNSLVSENAAALRRDIARLEILNNMNSQSTPESSDDTSGFLFLPYHADATRSLRRPPAWSSSTFVPSVQRDREAPSVNDYRSSRTQGILRLRTQAEDERRAFNVSPPIPISPGLNHLMPDDGIPSREPPSLPSPDLGPVLSPILDIDNDPVYDISRPTPSRSSPLHIPNDTRSGQHDDFRDLVDELTRRRPAIRAINPDDYRPGIFRTTLQRYAELDRLRNPPPQASPPSLPPLGFEWEQESSQGNARTQLSRDRATRPAADGPTQHLVPAEDDYLRRFPGLNHTRNDESGVRYVATPWAASQRRRPPPIAIPDRHFYPPGVPNVLDHAPPHQRHARSNSDVHEHLSRRARIEGARIPPEQAQHPQRNYPAPTRGAEEGLSIAIEVMQHDGLSVSRSHQFMRQHQREREVERTRLHTNTSTTRTTDPSFGDYAPNDVEDITSRSSYRSRPMARRHEWSTVDVLDPSSAQNSDANAGSNGPAPSEREPHRLRMRAARGRLPANHTMGFMFGPSGIHDFSARAHRRGRPSGDYMRDEDLDTSYEGLLSLAATLGDAKPKSTPEHVVAGLPTGFYKDWATSNSDHRCPICLDDYKPLDPVLKLPACNHWLHKACLEQWLRGANTCPVCRNTVKTSRTGSEPDVGTSRTIDRDQPSALAALRARRAWVTVDGPNQSPDTGPSNTQLHRPATRQREALRIVPQRREPPPLIPIPGAAADINVWDTYRLPMTSSRITRPPPSWGALSDRTREGEQRNTNRGSESPPQPRGPRSRFGSDDDPRPFHWY